MGLFGIPTPQDKKPSDESKAPWHIPEVDNAILKPPASGAPSGQDKGFYFDPSGLERAAAAVKQLDSSKNAKYAYEISKEQEKTKQMEMSAISKQYEAQSTEKKGELMDKQAEAQRRLMEQQHKQNQEKIKYEDQVKRAQQQDYLMAQRKMKEEELRKQEESAMRQAEIQRKSMEYEASLKRQTEIAKIKAETEGKIKYERANQSLHLQEARLKAREYRDTVLQGISLAGSTIGKGVMTLLSDRDRLLAAAGTISLMAAGIYTAKVSTSVAGRFVESRLGKPSLVRETSRITVKDLLTRPLTTIRQTLAFRGDRQSAADDVLKGIVLENSLDSRMRAVARTAANTKANKAPFRHLLLYGAPGTGKTLYAKALAAHSGMDFAIMTGGDVAPLGEQGVTEIHKLFDWAQHSKKGLLILVDEADAFLQKRSAGTLSSEVRNSLNAFLYRTGETSDKFMLVFSSNQPDQFDWAINDRIDDMVEFKLPGKEERLRMIKYYFDQYIMSRAPSGETKNSWFGKRVGGDIMLEEDVNESLLSEMAEATDGFSGREISKLVIAWQAAAYGSESARLSASMIREAFENHLKNHRQKELWGQDQKQSVRSLGVIDSQ